MKEAFFHVKNHILLLKGQHFAQTRLYQRNTPKSRQHEKIYRTVMEQDGATAAGGAAVRKQYVEGTSTVIWLGSLFRISLSI